MPYIGASNSSHNSFMSLKEKHSIKKVVHSTQNSNSGSVSTLSLEKPNSESDIAQENVKKLDNAQNMDIESSSAELNEIVKDKCDHENDENFSSEITSENITSIPSDTALHNFEKARSTSIDSPLTDIDLQELYDSPNESTHSYSYNPLSPNSLAVRLSILKRSLEIIISNPNVLEDGALTKRSGIDIKSNTQKFSDTNSQKIDIPKTRNKNGENNIRSSRSMSLSVTDNIPKFASSQKWTSPTAALNAFVSNCQQNSIGIRNNTDPNIRTSLTMGNINRRSHNNNSNNNNSHFNNCNNNNNNNNIPLAHRANSLAFLPKIMSTYNMQNNVNGYEDPGIHKTSTISFRQPFKQSNESFQNSSSTPTNDNPEKINPEQADQLDDADTEYITEQRANLVNLLDLLNETLEKNTSSKATDLHMLSLFNIKKSVLERSSFDEINNENENEYESNSYLRLKRTLLDSLAQPFYERNIIYADDFDKNLQNGLEDFDRTQQSIDESRQSSQDYRHILRTFASAKNSAPQAIFTCSQRYPWQFKAANDLACLIFGISNNILKTLTLLDLIHIDSRNFVLHKILSTEDQELVFTGEIIGIVQPGNNYTAKNDLIWASFWAKRKNGLLVCVFEKVPCDYVDISLNLDNFEVNSILKKNNNNLLMDFMAFGDHITPKFQLGLGDGKLEDSDDTDYESDTDTSYTHDGQERKLTHVLHTPEKRGQDKKKTVKFANELQYVSTLSQSLDQLINDVREGKIKSRGDDKLSMPVRVTNHINKIRYFTLNHLSSNIPCAVSSSLLQNAVKIKIHSLPYIAGLFVIGSQSLQLISFNRSVSKNMFGLHYNELINQPMSTIIPDFESIIEFIRVNYPELDIISDSNRGLVLTEHFFRKIHADMSNDAEYFYSSIGINGRHRDGSLIKVDIQLRVLSSSISLIWITHSRDVQLDDYHTSPNQLSMFNENDLTYISNNSSNTSLPKKSTSRESVLSSISSTKLSPSILKESPSRDKTISPSIRDKKENYSVSTSSSSTSRDSNESKASKDTKETELNDDEINDPEMKRKLALARMYTKDKTQFVKEGNFKVDQNLIISKIGTFLTLNDASNQEYDPKEPLIVPTSSDHQDIPNGDEELSTTFLRTPSSHIGSHKHSKKFLDFVILQKMGEGAYGKVGLCLHKTKKYIVVIKMIFKERILVDTWVRDRNLGTIPSEIQIMATLNKNPHENILSLIDFFEDDEYYYIETPVHGETGCIDLFDLVEFKTNMTEMEAKLIFKQVVSGIRHLHKHGIVHRDIKDENVIVDSKGFVKLIDFGSATYVKSGPFDVFVGTIDYAAPEVLSGDPYEGKPQDIWAIGILLYTIIFKENPFYNIDEILEGDLKFNQSEDVSQECVELIRKTLNRNVQKRPTIEDIYQDLWLVI